jgi:hypothetical protein
MARRRPGGYDPHVVARRPASLEPLTGTTYTRPDSVAELAAAMDVLLLWTPRSAAGGRPPSVSRPETDGVVLRRVLPGQQVVVVRGGRQMTMSVATW